MGLAAGTRLGPYEILAPLGTGGMGEVYKAKDTRLDRTVAIKVLNSQLIAGPEVKARFEREARTISQLNHPNVCTLHDVGNENGTDFLVMEFLEGESLSDRLKRGALPVPEVLKIGVQVAEALDKAHRAGIIHRDLKPGNVMLTKSGAKLLDFGLAKPVSAGVAAGANPNVSVFAAAATMTSPASPLSSALTSAGAIIGTVQYMAPEQIAGQEADARSDVFAFGALLYEMATGKRAFDGKTQSSVVGAILANDPAPITSLQPTSPAALSRLVHTCLAKDPDERFQTLHDVKLRLMEIAEAPADVEHVATAPRASKLPWIAATVTALALLAVVGWYFGRSATPVHPVQFSFTPPADLAFNDAVADVAVISPDGQKLAFSATSQDGKWQLYVKKLDTGEVQLLQGSEDPLEPFWSPDSRSIAFGSQGKLKRVDLAGGGAQVLCDAARMTGGSWSSKGVILFGSDYGSVLYQVPATGGEPKAVTSHLTNDADFGHTSPWFLPDGNHFLYRIGVNTNPKGVLISSLDTTKSVPLMPDNTGAVYTPGYLLFVRNGALMAQPFDADHLKLQGEATPVVSSGVSSSSNGAGTGRFSVSNNGILVWQGGWDRAYQLRWFDREGKQVGAVGDVEEINSGEEPHLSPDGKQLVLKKRRDQSTVGGIWVRDLERGTEIRLRGGQLPLWMPDGKSVIFQGAISQTRRGPVRQAANGVGEPELLTEGVKFPHSMSPDGRFLLYLLRGEKTRLDVWALQMFGDKKEYPLLNSAYDERDPQISPDGKWMAYTSDESGSYEIYVRPFTADGKVGDDRRRISVNTGQQAEWNRDGKELFYLTEDGQLMSVAVKVTGTQIDFGTPKALFRVHVLSRFNISHEYDVSPDGQRFLIGTLVGDAKAAPASIMVNWTASLKKQQ